MGLWVYRCMGLWDGRVRVGVWVHRVYRCMDVWVYGYPNPNPNITGDPCHNGQAPFWYSQGCFIGCDECDHKSGRRQIDLCGKGKVGMRVSE